MNSRIFEQNEKWIKIAKTFGANDFAQDLVQDTYIKLLEKKDVNEAYFYFALRSTCLDFLRKEKRIVLYYENDKLIDDEVYDYIDTWHPYDRKLYLTYINNNFSMRELSNQTGISLTSIFNTIKNCNLKLKNKFNV